MFGLRPLAFGGSYELRNSSDKKWQVKEKNNNNNTEQKWKEGENVKAIEAFFTMLQYE